MLKTNITDDERIALQGFSKTSPLHLVRQKCFAVLIADQGLGGAAIADVVGKTKRSVDRWIRDWDQLRSIFSGHESNGNAAKLTKDQQEHIRTVYVSALSGTTLRSTKAKRHAAVRPG